MAKDWAKGFYNSKEWRKCRRDYIIFVLGLCEVCGRPGYILHHKTELTPDNIDDPDIAYSWDNLQYLCQDCHNKTLTDMRVFCFDEDGQPVAGR